METNRRFTILTFPQHFDGHNLTLNILFLPRNQNPLKPAIESHATIPKAPPFAEANLSFVAKIITGLEDFPMNVKVTKTIPLVTKHAEPAADRAGPFSPRSQRALRSPI